MNANKLPIEQLKIAEYIKVSKDAFLAHEDMDYYRDLLTVSLIGHVYSAAKETGTLTVYVKRPSFIDWLLRREKTITVPYTINHLIKGERLPKHIDSIPIIRFDKP